MDVLKKVCVIFAIFILLCGCKSNESKAQSNQIINYYEEIYSLENESVYSNILNLSVKIENKEINLQKGLYEHKISIEDLISKLDFIESNRKLKMYTSNGDTENGIKFYLAVCSLNSNEYIFIGHSENVRELCEAN